MTDRTREMVFWAAAVLSVLGLVLVPVIAVVVLSVYGLVTFARYVPIAAARIGYRALCCRAAIGASIGPWLALAAPELGRADALQVAAAGAVLGVLSVEIGAALRDFRRVGVLEAFGLRASGRDPR